MAPAGPWELALFFLALAHHQVFFTPTHACNCHIRLRAAKHGPYLQTRNYLGVYFAVFTVKKAKYTQPNSYLTHPKFVFSRPDSVGPSLSIATSVPQLSAPVWRHLCKMARLGSMGCRPRSWDLLGFLSSPHCGLRRAHKAAQPRSSEKNNAASRAGQTPYARWAVTISLLEQKASTTAENRAFEEKKPLVF